MSKEISPEGKKLSPKEKGVLNRKNYKKYIAELERTGKKFPINQHGEVNKDVVAKACGFNRQVFRNNEKMGEALEKDVERIGTVGQSDEPVQESESALAKKSKKNAELVSKLRKDLTVKDETINALKAQIIELENAKAQLEEFSVEQRNSFDFMVSTGRRFTL